MSQKLPVNGFEWIEDLSQFKKNFIKIYDEDSDIEYFLEVDVENPKKLFNLHKDLTFLPEREKIAYLQHTRQRKLCCSNKSFKTSIKLWINTKRGTQSNST